VCVYCVRVLRVCVRVRVCAGVCAACMLRVCVCAGVCAACMLSVCVCVLRVCACVCVRAACGGGHQYIASK
jgi:hypothetical protein